MRILWSSEADIDSFPSVFASPLGCGSHRQRLGAFGPLLRGLLRSPFPRVSSLARGGDKSHGFRDAAGVNLKTDLCLSPETEGARHIYSTDPYEVTTLSRVHRFPSWSIWV